MCHGQIIDDAIRKARKCRTCVECRRAILPGEKYEHQVSKDGGDFNVWDACVQCASKNAALWTEINDDMCYVTSLRDAWAELIDGLGPRQVRDLYTKAKARVFGMREKPE